MKPEAHEDRNGNIYLATWFKWAVGIILGMIMAANAYVYAQVLPIMANNIITNDRQSLERDKDLGINILDVRLKIEKFGILEQKIDGLSDDMREIKSILRRTTPYERNAR